ncbi:MAG: minor capsid protein [Bacteroidales bacterium]|nr:minor capsid protein [Bacteroidales bacterium]
MPVLTLDDLLKQAWENPGTLFNWHFFDYTRRVLTDALVRGWKYQRPNNLAGNFLNLAGGEYLLEIGDIGIEYGSEDRLTAQMMELNLFKFSASKSLAMANKLNGHLKDSASFAEFSKKATADKEIAAFNLHYLETEYNFAWSVGQNAANYHRMMGIKDVYPSWIYRTQADTRVRESHRVLEGRTFKAGDPAIDVIYPPNGWGCRCYIEPSTITPDSYDDPDKAIGSLGKEYENMQKHGFDINRAKANVVFDANKMYVNNVFGQKTGIKDNAATPYEKMEQDAMPVLEAKERTAEWAKEWHSVHVKDGFLKDYAGRELIFNKATLESHLKENRPSLIEFIPEILSKPDEVWFFKDNQNGKLKLRYISYYKDKPLNVVIELDKMKLNSWYDIDTNKIDTNVRNGFLIKKNL